MNNPNASPSPSDDPFERFMETIFGSARAEETARLQRADGLEEQINALIAEFHASTDRPQAKHGIAVFALTQALARAIVQLAPDDPNTIFSTWEKVQRAIPPRLLAEFQIEHCRTHHSPKGK